ncbi:hypothetical protein OOK58_46050 [Streptomyces sp. NBC_01728]|uniref:hypothetical protein n=1 Tax=unclassified Streptomyces TaxID=2593676 RepID=UPI00224CE120|nr:MULTISPECIES: hypothetical protein [unclassified Streptomyces]MCX4459235.1 hypothetical protein [Streptomyces sp. NBC_01719]MCX4498592.1 hypothetical protein [Streptomyces sp. NBC_01728]
MDTTGTTPLRAVAFVRTLSPSPAASSSHLLAEQTMAAHAPNAVTYWVGEAMQGTDYQDLDKTPEATVPIRRFERAPTAQSSEIQASAESAPRPGEPLPTPALRQLRGYGTRRGVAAAGSRNGRPRRATVPEPPVTRAA